MQKNTLTFVAIAVLAVISAAALFVAYGNSNKLDSLANKQSNNNTVPVSFPQDSSVSDYNPFALAFCNGSARKNKITLGAMGRNGNARVVDGKLYLTASLNAPAGAGINNNLLNGNFLVEVIYDTPIDFAVNAGKIGEAHVQINAAAPNGALQEVIFSRIIRDRTANKYFTDFFVKGTLQGTDYDGADTFYTADRKGNPFTANYVGHKDGYIYSAVERKGNGGEITYVGESKSKLSYGIGIGSTSTGGNVNTVIRAINVYQCTV